MRRPKAPLQQDTARPRTDPDDLLCGCFRQGQP